MGAIRDADWRKRLSPQASGEATASPAQQTKSRIEKEILDLGRQIERQQKVIGVLEEFKGGKWANMGYGDRLLENAHESGRIDAQLLYLKSTGQATPERTKAHDELKAKIAKERAQITEELGVISGFHDRLFRPSGEKVTGAKTLPEFYSRLFKVDGVRRGDEEIADVIKGENKKLEELTKKRDALLGQAAGKAEIQGIMGRIAPLAETQA